MNVTFPVALRKTLPPIQLDDAGEAEVLRQIANAARHHADFGIRQTAQRWFVKMIEMRVREQHQINSRQILDFQPGAFDALQKKQPVRKIRINQNIQICELNQKRRVADPGDGDLAVDQLRENRTALLADAPRQQRLPNQFAEKRARIEMSGRR